MLPVTWIHVNSTDLGMWPSHLFHLRQVRIDIVAEVFWVPVRNVPVYLLFQESCDLAVVGEDGLMRSWQVFHQGGEAVVQLSAWQGTGLVTVPVCAHNPIILDRLGIT